MREDRTSEAIVQGAAVFITDITEDVDARVENSSEEEGVVSGGIDGQGVT